MTDYRVVMRHVGYWRGNVHRWSTVYPLSGNLASADYLSVIGAIWEMEQGLCYPSPSGVEGGTYEGALYNQAVGGVPISVQNFFDPTNTAAWVAYSGAEWPDTTHTLETVREVALQVDWLAGLSRTGKPVRFRKWYHSVPVSGAVGAAGDITGSTIATMTAFIQAKMAVVAGKGAPLGNSSRLAAATPQVNAYYGTHQMPRGRRKPPTRISSSVAGLPPGILVVPGSDGSLDS
jgi:hypothetical protein